MLSLGTEVSANQGRHSEQHRRPSIHAKIRQPISPLRGPPYGRPWRSDDLAASHYNGGFARRTPGAVHSQGDRRSRQRRKR